MFDNIALIAALALLVWGVVIYNRLVRHKHLVREAWSGIDVQLKRRHSLLPNLVAAVRAYADYEQELLMRITRERTHGEAPAARATEENELSHDIRRLLAVVEAYPELKANQGYLDLQHNLSEVEEQIQFARRYYNGTVRNLNIAIESFPGNLVSGWFAFQTAEFFEIEEPADRAVPKVGFDR